jgi:hypothetical protein
VISIALLVWQLPVVQEFVPDDLKTGLRVSPENQSRSILLNVLQRGIGPPIETTAQLPGPAAVRRHTVGVGTPWSEPRGAPLEPPSMGLGIPGAGAGAGPHDRRTQQ